MKTLMTIGLSAGLLTGSETLSDESSKGKRAEKLIGVEQKLLGAWSVGQSLIRVIHTFHVNGQYSVSIAKEFNGGKLLREEGGWRLADDLIEWWTPHGQVVAQILRINDQTLELHSQKGKHVFTRLSRRSTLWKQSNEPT